MAQPPQFRPGPPGPPGPPQGPPGPPGPPGLGGMRPSYVNPIDPSISHNGGDNSKKKGKKKRRDDSSSDEDECKCPPSQPATQIFITPPGMPPPVGQSCGCCDANSCPENGGRGRQDYSDPAKLCQLQCYQGQGRQDDTQTQVICCPPTQCRGCQQKKQRQQRQQSCCECGEDTRSKKQKKPQYGTMEGMMPATQQFLMFLQAYGLAAALIRDRNKREDERAEKERGEKEERKSDRSEDHSSGRKGSNSPPRKGSVKEKGKKKKEKE